MLIIVFALFVATLGILMMGSGLQAHIGGVRIAAGWWAGVIIALVVLVASHSQFSELPIQLFWQGSYSLTEAFSPVVAQTVQLRWHQFILGLILWAALVEVLNRSSLPDHARALLMLLISAFSLYSLVHLFAIGLHSAKIFSFSIGGLLGILFRAAFRRGPAVPTGG